jgi:hypothetical protein
MQIHSFNALIPIPNHRRLWAIVLMILMLFAFAACSGPRGKLLTKAQAMRDNRAMRLEIIAVYNNDRMDYTTEFHVSHVIDANVLDGPPELVGKPIVLPYDLFFVAKPPPLIGEVVVASPMDWVKRNEAGKAREFGQ